MPLKKPSVGGSDYRVFQDTQRHTCIRVRCEKPGVWFIPLDTVLDLQFLPHKEFEMQYVIELKDYPVRKAANTYLAPWQGVTPEAKRHLMYLTGGVFADTAKPLIFNNKESIMTEEAKAAAETKAKKVAAPKAEKAPGKKATAPAPAKKPTKGAAKKVAAPDAEKAERGTRVSKEAGRKIKVLDKNPAVRPGSAREEQYKVLLSCKTTDEAGEKLRDLTNKPWDLVRLAVTMGVIELV